MESHSLADYERRWHAESTAYTEKTGVTLAGMIKNISESIGIPIATGQGTDRKALQHDFPINCELGRLARPITPYTPICLYIRKSVGFTKRKNGAVEK